ncbi:MAG: phage tail protein [Halodesulfovibrio sp.]|uniref:phage tail-collar fiber domain-containing protein n=1 Tax=Halodesulfovibrio sp. TaxID=1912772 RepID=UPI00359E144D
MALILTKAGLAALVEAEESGTKLQATHMALGDGNGSVPEHTTSSPSLINEVWRGALQSITINEQGDSDAGKQVVFEVHVPINAGGWYIREAALYAGDVLLAIGTHPVMWKPAPEEPTKMEHVIKAPVTFGNAGAVSLIVDPTVVLASQEFVNEQLAEHNGSQDAHPHLKKLLDQHTHTWSVITGKPSVFPPAAHTHIPAQAGLGNLPNAKSDSVTSTSGNSLATSKAVKIAYDKGKQALDLAGQKAASNHNHNSVYATKTHTHTSAQAGLGNLPNAKSDSVAQPWTNQLATSLAVKTAYDKGKQALDLAGQKAASNHNHNTVYATKAHTHTPAQAGLGNLPNAKSDVVNSTRSDVLATSRAVKTAYDRGSYALSQLNKVTQKSSRSSSGTWTLTGLVTGRPVIFCVFAPNDLLKLTITSGAVDTGAQLLFGGNYGQSIIVVPTSTVLVVEISAFDSSSTVARAFH